MDDVRDGKQSRTNWGHLDALTDEEIDTTDSPPLSDDFFAKAQWLLPGDTLSHSMAAEKAKIANVT